MNPIINSKYNYITNFYFLIFINNINKLIITNAYLMFKNFYLNFSIVF